MKRISRMIVFSGVALYLTSIWDKGFVVVSDWQSFLIVTLLFAAICYLIVPLSRIILLPLNILTMGFFSGLLYVLLIYILDQYTGYIDIQAWVFPGIKIFGQTISKMSVGSFQNLLLSSYLLSVIINLLERII